MTCVAFKLRSFKRVISKNFHAKRLCDLAHMADEPQSTDVLGSYTGTAQDGEHPVQDADDL